MNLAYWWMFPASIVIASFAMTVGVGGPVFFSPIFILVFGFSPPLAFGTALMTQVFGFASGTISYARQKLIDFSISRDLLVVAIPFAVIGALVSGRIDHWMLTALFGIWTIISALIMFRTANDEKRLGSGIVESEVNVRFGQFLSALGGATVGLTSTGMGNVIVPWMNVYCKMPIKKTVATSVFIVFITVLAAALTYFFTTPLDVDMLIFTVPGVLIGGQIGPRISKQVDPVALKIVMSIVFFGIGLIMLASLVR